MDRRGNRRGQDLTGTPVRRFAATRRTDILALLVAVGIGAWIVGLGARFTFFYDEWSFVLGRELDVRSLLTPHNGHLTLIPVAVYSVLLRLAGMESYLPFRLVGVACHLAVCFGAYMVVSRRRGWPLGLVALVCTGVLGSGWQNILWPFQMTLMAPVAFALFGVWIVERRPDADASVASLVGASLLFSGGGVSVLAAFTVQSVAARAWKRLAMLAGVGALYGTWFLLGGEPIGSRKNLPLIAEFVRGSVEHSAAGIGGRGGWFAVAVGAVFLIGLVVSRRTAPVSPSVIVPLVAFVVGAVLTGYSRGNFVGPDASRYVYVGAVYLIVLVLVVVPWSPRIPVVAALLPVTAWIVHPNIDVMRREAAVFRFMDDSVRAELAVIEAYGNTGNDMYRPIPDYAPALRAAAYLRAVERYGSPAMTAERLSTRDATSKSRLDRIAFEYARVRTTPSGMADYSSCMWSRVLRSTARELQASPVLVKHSRTVTLTMRMFSDEASDSTRITLTGDGVALLVAPVASTLPPWRFAVNHAVEIGICPGLDSEG